MVSGWVLWVWVCWGIATELIREFGPSVWPPVWMAAILMRQIIDTESRQADG